MKKCVQRFVFWAAFVMAATFSADALAQAADCDPDSPSVRYRSRDYFTNAPIVLTDVPYGTDAIQLMDIYLPPAGDAATDRPVIVWAHPGGFINGEKDSEGAVLWCTEMAKMGYVAVSIAYRKRMVINVTVTGPAQGVGSDGGAVRAVYLAIQDARSAIRYLKANAGTYGIDPNKVFMAGSSAGAVMAANVAYVETAERPWPTTGSIFPPRSNLGCVDCGEFAIEDDSNWNGDIAAGMVSWGGLEDFDDGDDILDVIDDVNDADGDGQIDTERMLFMHGADDDVVLPGKGKPFSSFGPIVGFLLPNLYGAYSIRERLDALGANAPQWEAHVLCNEIHEFELDYQDGSNGYFGASGVPDENFDYWFQESVDHFYHAIDPAMPETGPIETIEDDGNGDILNTCDSSSKGTYAPTAYSTYRVTSPNAGSSYCWDITKGAILTGQGTDEITVRWDDSPSQDDAVDRTGTVLCFETTTSGAVETVYKASHHLSLIVDGPTTAPAANFTSAAGAGVGQIDFTDASTNANHPSDTYEWDFGDGTSTIGTDGMPSHTYNMVGNYTVKLKAMNECGNRSDFEETVTVAGVTVSPKVYLQGPFNGTDMNGDLDAATLLPATEPYTTLGFAGIQNAGTGFAASFVPGAGGDVMEDWVLVELRDPMSPTTVVASRAAILQKDGDVVDIDNASAVGFINIAPGMYHVVVRHRNHLGVMTGMPVNLN